MRDAAVWNRVNRKAATLSPDLAREIRRAFRIIEQSLSDAEVANLIASGQFDHIVDEAVLDRAFRSPQALVRTIVEKGFQSAVANELPRQGKVDGQVAVAFDTLDANVVRAIRELDTEAVQTLKDDVRETVRAYVENGIRDGDGPRTIARDLRTVIGMSPTQEANAERYEAKLRAMANPPSEERIQKMVATYRRRAIALNAETNARTITLDSFKLGQKLSWEDAIQQGVVPRDRVRKRWKGVMDDRERDEHVAMEGETVGFDEPYSNGEMIPGESTFNCRCVSVYLIGPAA